MWTQHTWLKHIVLLLLFGSAAVSQAAAQTLESALMPGRTVWITGTMGEEIKTRVVNVSDETVTVTAGNETRRFLTSEIRRVRARHSDSVLNGALIGAAAAVASGLAFCTTMEPWQNCRDDVGPMLRIGALGAGIGIGIDALIRGRRTIYEASSGPTSMNVAPIITRRGGGVKVSFGF